MEFSLIWNILAGTNAFHVSGIGCIVTCTTKFGLSSVFALTHRIVVGVMVRLICSRHDNQYRDEGKRYDRHTLNHFVLCRSSPSSSITRNSLHTDDVSRRLPPRKATRRCAVWRRRRRRRRVQGYLQRERVCVCCMLRCSTPTPSFNSTCSIDF